MNTSRWATATKRVERGCVDVASPYLEVDLLNIHKSSFYHSLWLYPIIYDSSRSPDAIAKVDK